MRFCAVDTETTLIPSQGTDKINLRHEMPELVCVSFSSPEAKGVVMYDDYSAIHAIFSQEDIAFVFHNAAFDLEVLSQVPGLEEVLLRLVKEGRVYDTKVMYLNRDPDPAQRAITLDFLSRRLLRRPLDKGSVRTSFRRGDELSEPQKAYALQDAVVTRELAETMQQLPLGSLGGKTLQKLIATHPRTKLPHPDVVYSKAAAYCAWHLVPEGMEVDRDTLQQLFNDFSDKARELQNYLVHLGLARIVRKAKSRIEDKGECSLDVSTKWHPLPGSVTTVQRRQKGRLQVAPAKVVLNEKEVRSHFQSFAESEGITPKLSKKTRKLSLSRDDWKDYETSLPYPLQKYMEYQKTSKYLSAFLSPLQLSQARRVHPAYWIPGAATFRWACSKPNLQQVPKRGGLREIYRPKEGNVFVMADYPTLELYTLAHCMHSMGIHGPLLQALESGQDVHSRTAAMMFGVPFDEVDKEQRQGAKAGNFGLPGGMGARRFYHHGRVLGIDWTYEQAMEIRARWFSVYWDVRQYLDCFEVDPYTELRPRHMPTEDWLRSLGFDPDRTWPSRFELSRAVNDGAFYTVVLPSGRVIPDRRYSAAANSFFQGTGADVITHAFNLSCERGLNVVAVVHDSITVEVPEKHAQVAQKLLAKTMADALADVCPSVPRVTIECEVSSVWK